MGRRYDLSVEHLRDPARWVLPTQHNEKVSSEISPDTWHSTHGLIIAATMIGLVKDQADDRGECAAVLAPPLLNLGWDIGVRGTSKVMNRHTKLMQLQDQTTCPRKSLMEIAKENLLEEVDASWQCNRSTMLDTDPIYAKRVKHGRGLISVAFQLGLAHEADLLPHIHEINARQNLAFEAARTVVNHARNPDERFCGIPPLVSQLVSGGSPLGGFIKDHVGGITHEAHVAAMNIEFPPKLKAVA